MGTGVDFVVPRTGLSGSRGASPLLTRYRLDREAHDDVVRRRYLTTIFVTDRPRVLERALAAFDDGVALADGRVVRFSLDGSLASVLMGAGAVSLVVHPLADRAGVEPERSLSEEAVLEGIRDAVLSRVGDLPKDAVKVGPFDGFGQAAFDGKSRFTELRFRSSESDGGSLGEVAARFSAALGELDVPIAYLYFPDRWRTIAPRTKWLRVGIGFRDTVDVSVAVDLAAVRTAKEFGCELRKYDGSIRRPAMSERFRPIVEAPESDGDAEPSRTPNALDVLFLAGTARPGLVASWLDRIGQPVLGGSMTVLAGRTVSSWVVPHGSAERIATSLRQLAASDGGLPDSSFDVRVIESIRTNNQPHDHRHLWVAWRCRDEAGVLRDLLESTREFLEHHDVVSHGVNFEMSRVLHDAATCAGKVRFGVSGNVDLGLLQGFLDERMAKYTSSWRPSVDEWLSNPIAVAEREPAESPWASLAVG